MMNFIQGESWTQDLRLFHNGQPVIIGPADKADALVHSIEVVLKVNTRVQARYRYPYSDDFPKHELLDIDADYNNVLQIKITRKQSRFFEPGYLTAFTHISYKDPAHPEGRMQEVVQILGYMLKSDFAMRM
jgi:hypothetical protein